MTVLPVTIDLFNGIIASMNAIFGITIPTIGKNFLRNLAGTWAGKIMLLYRFLGNIQKNEWYDTADPVAQGGTLERFGMSYLQRLPFAATQGKYHISFTGVLGAVIPANTTFTSDLTSLNPGYLFILDTAYVCSGLGEVILLRAVTAGTVSNLAVGNTLTCTRPLVNITPNFTVVDVATSAIDAETITEYRDAIGVQIRLAPQGGAVSDYIKWGSPVSGVAKIYPYAVSGAPYQVNVYAEAILADSGGAPPDYNYGVPTATILDGVTAALLIDPVTGNARKPLGVILGLLTGVDMTTLDLPGLNYVGGDTGYINGGSNNARYVIDSVGFGGAVNSWHIILPGDGYAIASAVGTTAITGIGTGFVVNITSLTGSGALPVTVKQIAIAFTGSSSMTTAQKTAIKTALQQAVNNIRPFIAGADVLADQNDTISVNLPATGGRLAPPNIYVVVVIAMAAAPGALFTGCTMTVDSTPETSYTFDQGNIPYLQLTNVSFT